MEACLDNNGEWIYDQLKLKVTAVKFYFDLLTLDLQTRGKFVKGLFPNIPHASLSWLKCEFKEEEISRALREMTRTRHRAQMGLELFSTNVLEAS